MWFLGIGLVLLVLKYMEMTFVATWSWWWIALPFVLAACWWAYADWSGLTKSRASEKMEVGKLKRLNKHRKALGLAPKKPRIK